MKTVVSVVKCGSLIDRNVESAVRRALDLIGGIKEVVKPDCVVLIKPNVGTASSREGGMTTDPSVVKALIYLAKEAEARKVIVGEASVVGVDTLEAFRASGVLEAAEEAGAEVIDFKRYDFIEVPVPASPIRKNIRIAKAALEADVIINAPKLKTITAELISVSLKNLKGLLSDSGKRKAHRVGLSQTIVDLNSVVKPSISVIDGIIASELYQPRKMGVILASRDLVAADAIAARLIGIKPRDVIHLRLAANVGLGISDLARIEVRGEKIERFLTTFKTAPRGLSDLPFKNLKILDGSPCTGCVGALYKALKNAEAEGLLKELKGLTILVGPDLPSMDLSKYSIAVGNCLRECKGCITVKGCPPRSIEIMEALKFFREQPPKRT